MCERVVEERVRAGLPGVAIQWGGVGDVGVLADTLGEIEVCWPCTAYVQCSLKYGFIYHYRSVYNSLC